jgi:4,5:9,10-diseco-3-hydroxy-5,9,17-trioxoandrosta-1(10),2-diene-4-oate hydrolase
MIRPEAKQMIAVKQLGYLVFEVSDLAAWEDFGAKVLGLQVVEAREIYMEMEGIQAMLRALYKEGLSKESIRKLFTLQLHDESKITDEVIEERFQVAMTQHRDNIARIRVANQEDRLPEIQCPVLCFWGANDKFCPSSGASKIATRCANSRTMLIASCGHWVMVEYPKLFNELTLNFLNNDLG